MLNEALKLYGVISSNGMSLEIYLKKIEESIRGGVTMLQFREKTGSFDERARLGARVKEITDVYGIPLIVNDDPLLCKKIDAGGVHLGQTDGSVTEAREFLGNGRIIGVTARSVAEAERAAGESADYVGSGAVFPTATKLDAKPMEMKTLRAICSNAGISVVAIGGISHENIHMLSGSGISGVAVVGSLYGCEDTYTAAVRLRRKVDEL